MLQEPNRYEHTPYAYVGIGLATALSSGGWAPVSFDSVYVNEMGIYKPATREFVMPKAGRVQTTVNTLFRNTAATDFAVGSWVKYSSTGALLVRLRVPTSLLITGANGFNHIGGTNITPVEFGDRLKFEAAAYNNCTWEPNTGSEVLNYVSVSYVP